MFFEEARIMGFATFKETTFEGAADFSNTTFGIEADFRGAKFQGPADFSFAKIEDGDAEFDEAIFSGETEFLWTTVKGGASFKKVTFVDIAYFMEAVFEGDVSFEEATIDGESSFHLAEIKGCLNLKNTTFRLPEAQEEACRKAKQTWEKLGDRDEADRNFYREMEAKRKQKPPYRRYPEWLLFQSILGYGIRPFRFIGYWLLVILVIFPISFWLSKGVVGATDVFSYVYFSVVTAVTLGYGNHYPTYWLPQMLVIVESVVGIIAWAAFIAMLSRKYMR